MTRGAREPGLVEFEYTGRTGLTVTGPFTRMQYRFPQPGARLRVDERDAAGLAAVPVLQMHRA